MINSTIYSSLDAVKAKVEIYNASGTRITTCTCEDVLSDFTVSREGVAGKFFGFGICHKLKMRIIDLEGTLQFSKGYYAQIYYGDGSNWDKCYPKFYFDEISVDKKTGDITIVAYDKLKSAPEFTFEDLGLTASTYTLGDVVYRAETVLGLAHNTIPTSMSAIQYSANVPANYEGTEDIRNVLDDAAECVCSIYYLNQNELLVWKQVCIDGEADLQVQTSDYYEWEEGQRLALATIYATNELSDTVGVEFNANGNVVQYIRENGLLTLRTDIEDILTANGKAFSMTPFVLDWSGDYRLEIGDCIEIHNRESSATTKVYILNDEVDYAGTLSQATSWDWTDNDAENEKTPVNITDKINQTFAKVDKVNKEITLLTSTVDNQGSNIAQLLVNTNSVTTKVTDIESKHNTEVDTVNGRIDTLTKETAMKVDAEGVEIIVEQTLSEGVEKVVTATKKYSFDDTGLNISSSGSNISTTITEDGMRIYRAGEEVLTADNEGVKAEDLHATTFLIIGTTSRLEDRENRTACFWIGD